MVADLHRGHDDEGSDEQQQKRGGNAFDRSVDRSAQVSQRIDVHGASPPVLVMVRLNRR
jgi:hypothetical protein